MTPCARLLSRMLDLLSSPPRASAGSTKRSTPISTCSPTSSSRKGMSPSRRAAGGAQGVRRRRSDQGALSRSARPAVPRHAGCQDVRFALRLMRKNPASRSPRSARWRSASAHSRSHSAPSMRSCSSRCRFAIPARCISCSHPSHWSYPDYRDLRDRVRDVDALIGYRIAMMNVGLAPEPSILLGLPGDRQLLRGARHRRRRPDDSSRRPKTRSPALRRIAVISYDTWQSRSAAEPTWSAASSRSTDFASPSLGVAPKGFHGTEVFYRPEIWVPMSMQAQIEVGSSWLTSRETQNVMVIARLRAGRHQGAGRGRLRGRASHSSIASFRTATPADRRG